MTNKEAGGMALLGMALLTAGISLLWSPAHGVTFLGLGVLVMAAVIAEPPKKGG